MSEYQYYEFLALDRPLTQKEIDTLRAISTRARITSSTFVNEYHWGNLKADPRDFMRRYFDAHVYLANWGTAIFMLRLPKETLDQNTLSVFAANTVFEVEAMPEYWVLSWSLEESEDYERFSDSDGTGWLGRLLPIRDELLRGDLRSLYIGWLAEAGLGTDEDTLEPLALAGLGELTVAQQSLAEFLEVNADLLAGAGIGSLSRNVEAFSPAEIDAWLDSLPQAEVRGYLQQMLGGEGLQAERALKNRFAARLRQTTSTRQLQSRTVRELWQRAEQAREQRLKKEAAARKQAENKRRKQRETYLATLIQDKHKTWQLIRHHAEKGSGNAYDMACKMLVDLAEAHRVHNDSGSFKKALQAFMKTHQRRRALVQRLVKTGLWR